MYKAKIINIDEMGYWWKSVHKVGDIIEVSDEQYRMNHRSLKPLEHFKMVTVSKKPCPHCGAWMIKRKKEIID